MNDLERHRSAVDAAGATLAARKAALYRDKKPIYAPEEMQRREAEALAAYRETFTEAADVTQAEIAEVEAELHRLDRAEADPLAVLTADDLTKANALAPFVKEDAETLPLAALADRVEDAAKGAYDRPRLALGLRYGQRRLEAERAKEGGGYGDEVARLDAALNGIRQRLFGSREKREALAARIAEARRVQSHVAVTQSLDQVYGGAASYAAPPGVAQRGGVAP